VFLLARKCITIKERKIDIKYLEWDSINSRHIAKKGINNDDIEDALLYGDWEIRKGQRLKHRGNVIQRFNIIAK
jgi:hypothetical protein